MCALGGADKERVGKVDHARVHIDVLAQFSACTRIPAQVLWHAVESGCRIRWNSHRRKCLDGRKRLQMSALEGFVYQRNSQWKGFPNFIFCLMLSFPKYVTMRKQRQKLCKVCSFADVGWYVGMPSHGHLEASRDIPVTQRDMPVSLA